MTDALEHIDGDAVDAALQAPENVERYRECGRCGYTFPRGSTDGCECPACHAVLVKQPPLPGTDELALQRERRQARRA